MVAEEPVPPAVLAAGVAVVVVAAAAVAVGPGPGVARNAAGSAPGDQARCLPTWIAGRGFLTVVTCSRSRGRFGFGGEARG